LLGELEHLEDNERHVVRQGWTSGRCLFGFIILVDEGIFFPFFPFFKKIGGRWEDSRAQVVVLEGADWGGI
jgi:hypothetical protein